MSDDSIQPGDYDDDFEERLAKIRCAKERHQQLLTTLQNSSEDDRVCFLSGIPLGAQIYWLQASPHLEEKHSKQEVADFISAFQDREAGKARFLTCKGQEMSNAYAVDDLYLNAKNHEQCYVEWKKDGSDFYAELGRRIVIWINDGKHQKLDALSKLVKNPEFLTSKSAPKDNLNWDILRHFSRLYCHNGYLPTSKSLAAACGIGPSTQRNFEKNLAKIGLNKLPKV